MQIIRNYFNVKDVVIFIFKYLNQKTGGVYYILVEYVAVTAIYYFYVCSDSLSQLGLVPTLLPIADFKHISNLPHILI